MVEQPQMKKVFAFCIVLEMNSFTTLFYVNTLHKEKEGGSNKKRTVNLLFFSTFMTSKSQIDFISFVLLLFFQGSKEAFQIKCLHRFSIYFFSSRLRPPQCIFSKQESKVLKLFFKLSIQIDSPAYDFAFKPMVFTHFATHH